MQHTKYLCRLTEHILENFTTVRKIGVIFLDVAKQFDKVCHGWHLYKRYKLIKTGLLTADEKELNS